MGRLRRSEHLCSTEHHLLLTGFAHFHFLDILKIVYKSKTLKIIWIIKIQRDKTDFVLLD